MNLCMASNLFRVKDVYRELFDHIEVIHSGPDFLELDPKEWVLGLEGGGDISTSLYHQNDAFRMKSKHPSPMTGRDIHEMDMFKHFRGGAGVIAICRGAQLAWALEGGELWQHVDNHAGPDHNMTVVETGEEFHVSSAHHQMLNLSGRLPKHELLGLTSEPRSDIYLDDRETSVEPHDEPEAVYLPEAKCCAFQFHPEFMHHRDRAVAWTKEVIIDKLGL